MQWEWIVHIHCNNIVEIYAQFECTRYDRDFVKTSFFILFLISLRVKLGRHACNMKSLKQSEDDQWIFSAPLEKVSWILYKLVDLLFSKDKNGNVKKSFHLSIYLRNVFSTRCWDFFKIRNENNTKSAVFLKWHMLTDIQDIISHYTLQFFNVLFVVWIEDFNNTNY